MKLINTKIFQLLFLVALLFSASMSTYTVMADDHTTDTEDTEDTEETETEDDDSDDEDIEDDEREVKVEHSADTVTIESENEKEGREDEFKAELSSDEVVEIIIEYSSENETTESESEMKVEFLELIEYNDTNSDGVYNESVDTEIQTYEMEEIGFKPIEYTTQDRDGSTEHRAGLSNRL